MIDVVHICVAMKPLQGNFAQNAIEHGVSGLNVDGCRIGVSLGKRKRKAGSEFGQSSNWNDHQNIDTEYDGSKGRWPANVLHDGSEEVVEQFPNTRARGNITPTTQGGGTRNSWSNTVREAHFGAGDEGSASRFFKECPQDDD